MKNFTLKMFVIACILLSAGYSQAQFKFTTNTNIGQTLTTNLETHANDFVVDFNTAKTASTWSFDAGTSVYTLTLQKCQTQKGLQVNVFDADGTTKIINGDFECRDYGANRNPVHVANIDSLLSILSKFTIKNAGTGDSLKNVTWKPSACLFDVAGNSADQAFGAHPGKYKIVEYGFQYSFAGTLVSKDIKFDMDTYDAGNTGLTASYSLTVATGSATNVIGTAENIYVTGSGKKTISLAEAIGADPAVFSNSKVYFFLKTMGTGAAIAEGSYDPTVVFDNMIASYDLPNWVMPAAGVQANLILDNSKKPAVGIIGEESMFSLHLKTEGRISTLSIVNDLQNNMKQTFTFPDSLALKANDGNGNYTVNVPYTYTPGVLDPGTLIWSKAKIEVAAPASGSANDDMMFYFKATPASEDIKTDRLELNCGTRIWYDFSFKGEVGPTIQEWNISDAAFNALGTLTETTTVGGLTIYAAADKTVVIDANNKSINGMDFTSRLKLGGSGTFTEGVPSSRILAFDVTGNSTITVAAMSSSSGSDRELTIAAGSMDNVIGTFPALGASIGMQDFQYKGGATTIYVFSPSSGVNVYYLKSSTPAPVPAKKIAYVTFDKTMVETAASPANDPIVKMLQADANFDINVMVVAADSVFSLAGYDAVVVQEGFNSGAGVFLPGHSLALENIKVPFVYNKAYALRNGKAVTSATSSAAEIPGQLYLQVPAASQTSKLFSGITFSSDSIMLLKSGAQDDGSDAAAKAYSYALNLEMSDATTLLAKPKGAPENVSVSFNDIPAGTVLGTQDTLQARMIAISENFGAISKNGGKNLTNEGLTIWRNAVYMVAGLEVPATLFENVSTLDTLYTTAGTLTPAFSKAKMAYQLNLPSGTKTVSLKAMATSELSKVNKPGAIALSDGMDTEASVVVMNPLMNDSSTYTVYIHVQSDKEIAYLSNSGDGVSATAMKYDKNPVAMLKDAGYSVTLLNKNSIVPVGDVRFNYTPYKALVIAPGVSSSLITSFAQDGYPVPAICMQPDAPRKDKWGWTGSTKSDNKQMYVTKVYTVDSTKIKITNNAHYITANYQKGDMVTWTLGTPDSTDWSGKELKSYNLTDSIPEAVALGRIAADGKAFASIWAVTNGVSVRTLQMDNSYAKVALANRIVIMNVFNDGLTYLSPDFSPLLIRSMEWIMGAQPNAIAPDAQVSSRVEVFPNPANTYAKVRFNLAQKETVSLHLFNMVGQAIEIGQSQVLFAGDHELTINTQSLKNGLYVYRLKVGTGVISGKLNVAR